MSKQSPVLTLSALALACAALPAAHAARPTTPEVVVTASRGETALDDTLASVSVITRADIDAAGGADLVTLLRSQTGLDVARGGGLGQQTSVFLRGSNSNHVLVLIDGVRVSSTNVGAFAWEHLPLAQIERIEIVRGPRAALYGSEAIGGVIQVFTRRDAGLGVALSAGSHDTLAAAADAGWRGEDGGFGLRLGHLDSAGFNATRVGSWSFDPDRDGVVARTLGLDGDTRVGSQTLAASALFNDDRIAFDQGLTRARKGAGSATLSGALSDAASHRLALGAARETLDTPAAWERYDSRREQLDWQVDWTLDARQRLVAGLAWMRERGAQHDRAAGSDVFAGRRTNRALFAGWTGEFAAHRLELAARHDDNSVYGGETTGQAAWGWQLGDAVRLQAAWGQGFRAPTMNELYSPGWGGLFAGNPALSAERSDSAELGLRIDAAGWRHAVNLFDTRIDDLIAFNGVDFQAINVARARIRGAELETARDFGAWSLRANATWQDPENRDTGEALLRRPPRKGSVALSYGFDSGARIGADVFAASRTPDYGVMLPGYGVVGVFASAPLGRGFSLDARLDNLADRDYSLVDGFHTPGFTALVTLRWRGE